MGSIPTTNGDATHAIPTIEVDVLVVGTGPAGASLSCFLASHGVKGLMVGKLPATARTPRAHFTNPAALECLRDIGLFDECMHEAAPAEAYAYYRYCDTLVGEEYLRAPDLSRNPKRWGDYEDASPCRHVDLPQNRLEPILIKYATQNGFTCRFDTELLSHSEDPQSGKVTSLLKDLTTNTTFHVVSKYLCAADGAKSQVAQDLGLEFDAAPSEGLALNVWYEADLSHVAKASPGLLHTALTPSMEKPPPWGLAGVNRFVRPWKEWCMVLVCAPGLKSIEATDEQIVERVRQLIGDPKVEVKLKSISKWRVNERHAKQLSKGSVFCLGDAVHSHSPGSGLGSNTGVQDAYNLAWKLAYVLNGRADPSLLNSYSLERQPVAQRIVKVANDAFRRRRALMALLGARLPTKAERMASLAELKAATPEAAERRKGIREALKGTEDYRSGLGGEMNQTYLSKAVYTDDEAEPAPHWPFEGSEGIQHHTVSTYPGFRLPHAWLAKPLDHGNQVSTHDLAGKGKFVLFTGIGGKESWTAAAKAVNAELGHDMVKVYSIGWGQDYEDTFYQWFDKSEVEENGAVLVRPDRTVGWRSKSLIESGADAKLSTVIRHILSRS